MPGRLTRLPWWARLSLAVPVGVAAAAGFAPLGWWPVLLVAVAVFTGLTRPAPTWWLAGLTGYFFGLGFLGVSLRWMTAIYVEAMLGLVAMEALFFAFLGVLLWLSNGLRWWPMLAAGGWTVTEFAFSRVPFDGFPWMRLGYALVDSPLAGLLPFVGVAGVGFLGALVANLGAASLVAGWTRRGRAVGLAVVVLVSLLGWAGTAWTPSETAAPGEVSAGYVQGNAPGGGVYGLGVARTITRNHLAETQNLMRRVRAGELPQPDLVVWPENGTDLDPFRDAETARIVAAALATTGTPMLIGTITDGPGADERQTASVWFDAQGKVAGRYDKRNIVPFGEWVPYREQLLPLFPVLQYVGPQSVPGTKPGVLDVQVAGKPLRVGLAICYEVAFDTTMHDTVTHGAQVLIVQSSNAMYAGTDQVRQQFAITRARAAELRREILVVTTTGVSGLIRPDGSVAFVLPEHQPASGVTTLPLRQGLTPVVWVGPWVEGGLAAAAALAFALLAWRRPRPASQ